MRSILTVALAILLGVAAPPGVSAQSPHDLMQRALVLEQAEGDLRGAIALYQRIVAEHGDERAVAATALLQMGECYEKLGRGEASAAYRQVLERYPDQTEAAARAEGRLQALARLAAATPAPAPEPSGIRASLVWDGSVDPDVDGQGAPLPDGRGLVYIDWTAANLAVRDLATGQSRLLTEDGLWGVEAQRYPVNALVSPNGAEVAYSWVSFRYGLDREHEYELRVLDLETGRWRVLLPGGEGDQFYPFAWSPDGERLLVGRYIGNGGHQSLELGTLPAAGGEFHILKLFARAFWVSATFSPDGRNVVLSHPVDEEPGRSDILLIPLDGGPEVPLVTHAAHDHLLGWVPGTRQILFRSDRSGAWDVWAQQVGAAGPEGPPRPVGRRMGEIEPLGFTTDGTLFYSTFTRWLELAVAPFDRTTGGLDLDGAELVRGSNLSPVWAPDGRRLAYIHEVTRGGDRLHELHTRDRTTGETRHLASGLMTHRPSWTADGSALVVLGRREQEGPVSFYRIDAMTGHAEEILEVPREGRWWLGRAVWAPGGEAIVFTLYDRLVRRDVRTGEEEVLFQHPRLIGRGLAFSPDGQWLALAVGSPTATGNPHAELDEGGRILLLPAAGGEARELARITSPGLITDYIWGPGADCLYFLQRDGKNVTRLWRVRLDGSDPEVTWEADQWIEGLSIHPDGDRAAISSYTQEQQIWKLEGLLEVLREQS
jgi:Tol biopolymer transport system component